MKVDVAIVGAGPAGSTLAALLAKRGISVALIDRDRFPRDKLCGEFLSYDALPILDCLGVLASIDEHRSPAIDRCRVVGRSATYEFELPRAARGVSRMLLDDLLFRLAISNGAVDCSGQTATHVAPDKVEIQWGAGDLAGAWAGSPAPHLQARVVVGAWGRWGRFDAQLGRRFVRDRSHRSFGFKRHYRAVAPSTSTIELYSFRRGYLGVSPVEGGLTNICGLVHADRIARLKGRWDAFVDEIRREEPVLDAMYAQHEPAQDAFLSSEPVIFRSRSAVEGGVVMAGDASGIVDPLTGNGMAMAIQSALLAAPFIVKMLESADRQRADDAYRSAHHAFFAPRIRWSRQVARLLANPALLNLAMRTVRTKRPGQLLLSRTRASEGAVERLVSSWFW